MQFLQLSLVWAGLFLQGRLITCHAARLHDKGGEKQETKRFGHNHLTTPAQLLKALQTALFSYNGNFHLSESTKKLLKQSMYSNSRIRSLKLLSMKLKNSGESENKEIEDLGYETLWLTGSRAQTVVQVTSEIPHGKHTGEPAYARLNEVSVKDSLMFDFPSFTSKNLVHSRRKRSIFGEDNRVLISKEKVRLAPFSSVVMVSTGCTGTLISPRLVLTAAHCVHNGARYLAKKSRFRVGFLRKKTKKDKRVKWVRVRCINIPNGWTRKKSIHYDYAVLELIRPQKKRPYMEIGIVTDSKTKMHIHFASFPGDKARNTMWYAHCNAKMIAGVIANRCDATKGSSGAGVYLVARNGKKVKRVIVGILSSSGSYSDANSVHHRNGATRITPSVAKQICGWVTNKRFCRFFKVSKRKRSVLRRRG